MSSSGRPAVSGRPDAVPAAAGKGLGAQQAACWGKQQLQLFVASPAAL